MIEAWRDRFATWRHDVEIKAAAGDDVELELEEGARILESLAAGARRPGPQAGARRGRRAAAPVLHAAGAAQRRARRPGGRPGGRRPRRRRDHRDRAPLWVDRPLRRLRRLVRAVPPQRGRLRRARRSACRPSPTWASTSSTCRRSTRSASPTARARTTRSTPVPTIPAARGPSARPRAATPPSPPSSAPSRTSGASSARPATSAWRWRSTTRSQCSPDHPWVTEHPEWFHQRPDGSIRYAENPPKKYQDIYPINFWPERDADRAALWKACRDVLRYWIDQGIRVFRVDNPHTKPMAFWAWLIERDPAGSPRRGLPVRGVHPAQGHGQAGRGRLHAELHVLHLAHRGVGAARVRRASSPTARRPTTCGPTSGPTRPTSSSGPLRNGPPAAFRLRFVLAATLVPSYGHVQRLRAVRERAGQRRQRGVPALREVRDPRARLGPGRLDGPVHRHRQRHPASRTRRSAGCATSGSTASANEQLPRLHPGPRPTTATWCWWS